MIAGADAGPLRQVPRTGEPAHVSACFGDHGVDDQPVESRNGRQQLFGRLEGLGARVDLFGQRRDGGVEEVDAFPRSSGSTSASSAGRSPGSRSAARLRPPPSPRTRPGSASALSSSRSPRATVPSRAPAARATTRISPCPSTCAPAPSSSAAGVHPNAPAPCRTPPPAQPLSPPVSPWHKTGRTRLNRQVVSMHVLKGPFCSM